MNRAPLTRRNLFSRTVFFIALTLAVVVANNAFAQELKDVLRENTRMEKRDAVVIKEFEWPPYDWKLEETNYSQVFAGRAGARLPLMWLGEPGSEYVAGEIAATSDAHHLEAFRKIYQTMSRGGLLFKLKAIVPHPLSQDWARLGVIKEFKRLTPNPEEVKGYLELKIKGFDAIFFTRQKDSSTCELVVKMPKSVLINLWASCQSRPLMIELLESLDFERLAQKLNS